MLGIHPETYSYTISSLQSTRIFLISCSIFLCVHHLWRLEDKSYFCDAGVASWCQLITSRLLSVSFSKFLPGCDPGGQLVMLLHVSALATQGVRIWTKKILVKFLPVVLISL